METAVIKNPRGKFLRSAWIGVFSARCRWVSEFAEATTYTEAEATDVVRRLRPRGVRCCAIADYNTVREREIVVVTGVRIEDFVVQKGGAGVVGLVVQISPATERAEVQFGPAAGDREWFPISKLEPAAGEFALDADGNIVRL